MIKLSKYHYDKYMAFIAMYGRGRWPHAHQIASDLSLSYNVCSKVLLYLHRAGVISRSTESKQYVYEYIPDLSISVDEAPPAVSLDEDYRSEIDARIEGLKEARRRLIDSGVAFTNSDVVEESIRYNSG